MTGLEWPIDAEDSVGGPMDCDGAMKTLLMLLLVLPMGPNHFLYLFFFFLIFIIYS